jgi:hypothetical protein
MLLRRARLDRKSAPSVGVPGQRSSDGEGSRDSDPSKRGLVSDLRAGKRTTMGADE